MVFKTVSERPFTAVSLADNHKKWNITVTWADYYHPLTWFQQNLNNFASLNLYVSFNQMPQRQRMQKYFCCLSWTVSMCHNVLHKIWELRNFILFTHLPKTKRIHFLSSDNTKEPCYFALSSSSIHKIK